MNNQVAKSYFPFQETESSLLVSELLASPDLFDSHLRRASTSLVLSMIYGLPPMEDSRDPVILRVNHFTERALKAAIPGAYLVEYFTWMEHLPRWMCAWRRYAEDAFKRDSVLFENLFADVVTRLVRTLLPFHTSFIGADAVHVAHRKAVINAPASPPPSSPNKRRRTSRIKKLPGFLLRSSESTSSPTSS